MSEGYGLGFAVELHFPMALWRSLSFASTHSPDGLGRQRIIGPVVLGIAAAQLLADLKIGGLPKMPKVGGELQGLEAGAEQLHEHGYAAAIDARRVGQSKAFLQADAEHRGVTAHAIVYPYHAA